MSTKKVVDKKQYLAIRGEYEDQMIVGLFNSLEEAIQEINVNINENGGLDTLDEALACYQIYDISSGNILSKCIFKPASNGEFILNK